MDTRNGSGARNQEQKMTYASQQDYKNRAAVVAAYPSAAKIVKVDGGWAVFEYMTDYETWKNQK